MAAAAAPTDPPGYFVGRPVNYEEQQRQAMAPAPAPAPAVDDHKAVNTQVPGYYAGRVQPRRSEDTGHNINTNGNADTVVQQEQEPSCFAKWFGCCCCCSSSGRS